MLTELSEVRLFFSIESNTFYFYSYGSTDSDVVKTGLGDSSVALPEGERVLALQFARSISDQEGAIWSVSQLLVHLLSANIVTCSIYFINTS